MLFRHHRSRTEEMDAKDITCIQKNQYQVICATPTGVFYSFRKKRNTSGKNQKFSVNLFDYRKITLIYFFLLFFVVVFVVVVLLLFCLFVCLFVCLVFFLWADIYRIEKVACLELSFILYTYPSVD